MTTNVEISPQGPSGPGRQETTTWPPDRSSWSSRETAPTAEGAVSQFSPRTFPARHWIGTIGPRPGVLSASSLAAVGAIAVHLVLPLPDWWPLVAGPPALAFNAALAWWQAGSHRVIVADGSGIRVFRKRRWSRRLGEQVGVMPRMPIGSLRGRRSRVELAGARMWIARSQYREVSRFEDDLRARFGIGVGGERGPRGRVGTADDLPVSGS